MRKQKQAGQIIIFAAIMAALLLVASASLVGYTTLNIKGARNSYLNQQALYLAQAGINKAIHELNAGSFYTGESDTALGSGTFTVTVTSIDSDNKQIIATGYIPNSSSPTAQQTVSAISAISADSISFHYGIQAGDGGFSLSNSSNIVGNVFSTGSIIGNNNNMIYGDVISAGAGGLVYGVHATGTIFSHTIGNLSSGTTIDKDAYYVFKINTTVAGTSHPNSPDQSPVALPISDAQITDWESQAAAGGTISSCDGSGNYTVTSSVSLGPIKIACNLVIKSSSGVLTVTGPIWVTGNITTQTGPTIRMDSSLGGQNVAIIADNPFNTTGSGIITVGQSSVFQGSGTAGSFVFLISQNNSAETGGSTAAVNMNQGTSALVAYASHGMAALSQSVNVKEVTAYKIVLTQSASVSYDTGLPSALFESGPGGSWGFKAGSYAVKP